MFDYLQIDARRERWLVGSADLALAPIGAMGRWRRPPPAVGPPRRILLFRLERIGDLLMTREAIAAVRVRAPQAEIHLVVGSWNEDLARLGSQADRVETLDAPWLSREGTRSPLRAVGAHAARWRRDGVDLAINFEPDIRSNALIAASGARRRVGWSTGGGATFLTDALPYDPTAHTADNMQRLVERALPEVPGARPPEHGERLEVSADAAARARQLLPGHEVSGPLIGVNPGCGRAIKQWPVDRFAEAATTLARTERATLVFLGSHAETPITDAVQRALPDDVHSIDLVGLPVPDLAAVLAKLSVLVVGDTGPMHLAAAVDTPVVAIFGPSDPTRYAPRHQHARVVHANLWCRPCNRIRRPPARCSHGVPDCLTRVTVEQVVQATRRILRGQP